MPTAEVTFDRSLLYERVREELRQRCQVEPGTPLPSLRQLSHELDVNHLTVSRALRDLESEGLVKVVPRKGVFVLDHGGNTSFANIELIAFNNDQNWVSDISSSILQGMSQAAKTGMVHGTTLHVPPFPPARDFIRLLRERHVGAVLFLGVDYLKYPDSLEEANFIHQIAQEMPVLSVGSPHSMVGMDSVYGDPRAPMREYLEACYEKGLRRFAFLGTYPERAAGYERLDVLKKFALTHDLPWQDRYMLPYSETASSDIEEFFAVEPHPEVIITADTQYASMAIMAMQRKGLKPGEDIPILTFSSTVRVQYLTAHATVILIEEAEVGKSAYLLAQKKMQDPQTWKTVSAVRVPARFLNRLLWE